MAAVLGIGSVLFYGMLIGPYHIEITHLNLEHIDFPKTLKGKRAVHLTDLHIRDIGRLEERVLSTIEALKPDLVLMTGDYVRWRGKEEGALEFLSRVHAPLGVWAVMGDYDYSINRRSCLFCHEKASSGPTRRHSVQFLKNELRAVNLEEGNFHIAGVDGEAEEVDGIDTSDLKTKDRYTLLLSHDPLYFKKIGADSKVFILAGDTHGGQIAFPGWLFGWFGYEKNLLFNQGYFSEGKKQMYVNRGIGTSHVPIRLFRRPEIVVVHF